ncbi:MAG: tyrosine--tRNA ligase [bacterium]
MEDAIGTLLDRGFDLQMTDPGLRELMREKMVTYYVGFDPTASSLHIGSLKQIMMMAQLQQHGHRPIAVAGGGTGMIGDPSGKTKERLLLSKDDLARNLEGISGQLARFLDFDCGENSAFMVNNADWLTQFSFIDFLRDVGKYFRVGEMLGKESVRARLQSDEGMSFTEFCYQLLQAYDFLHLCDTYDCVLQMGGSDQWGNITAGIDLIRKLRQKTAYGIITPLVTTSSGLKFGKTEAGTIWLDPAWTSPYEFYQYFVRSDDRDVINWLKIFTFVPMNEIEELAGSLEKEPEKREPHRRLAYEVTSLVHGKDEADKAVRASQALFGGGEIKDMNDRDLEAVFADVPSARVEKTRLEQGIALTELMAETGLSKSKSEARRTVQQGGAYVNNLRADSPDRQVSLADLASESMLVLRSGKKKYMLVKAV